MSNLLNLVGTYKLTGSYLIHSTGTPKLLITSRINITSKKAVNFLLNKSPNNEGYISSLYSQSTDTGIDTYNFDYKGVRYVLKQNKTEGQAVIETVKVTV